MKKGFILLLFVLGSFFFITIRVNASTIPFQKITDSSYLENMKFDTPNTSGTCSFVALSYYLGFLDNIHNDNVVNDTYLMVKQNKDGSNPKSAAPTFELHDKLVNYGHYWSIFFIEGKGATASQIEETFNDYARDYMTGVSRSLFSSIVLDDGPLNTVNKNTALSITKLLINSNTPVILVMREYSYSNNGGKTFIEGKKWHSVVVYGYKMVDGEITELLAHFGWGQTTTEYIIRTSDLRLQGLFAIDYNGEHVCNKNYFRSSIQCQVECYCGYRHPGHQYHNISYINYNVSGHTYICLHCSLTKTENHSWVHQPPYDSYCRKCGYVLVGVQPW